MRCRGRIYIGSFGCDLSLPRPDQSPQLHAMCLRATNNLLFRFRAATASNFIKVMNVLAATLNMRALSAEGRTQA